MLERGYGIVVVNESEWKSERKECQKDGGECETARKKECKVYPGARSLVRRWVVKGSEAKERGRTRQIDKVQGKANRRRHCLHEQSPPVTSHCDEIMIVEIACSQCELASAPTFLGHMQADARTNSPAQTNLSSALVPNAISFDEQANRASRCSKPQTDEPGPLRPSTTTRALQGSRQNGVDRGN